MSFKVVPVRYATLVIGQSRAERPPGHGVSRVCENSANVTEILIIDLLRCPLVFCTLSFYTTCHLRAKMPSDQGVAADRVGVGVGSAPLVRDNEVKSTETDGG